MFCICWGPEPEPRPKNGAAGPPCLMTPMTPVAPMAPISNSAAPMDPMTPVAHVACYKASNFMMGQGARDWLVWTK